MNSIYTFFQLPLPIVLTTMLYVLVFSSFLKLSIVYTVLVYGIGLRSLAGIIASLALAFGISHLSLSDELDQIFKETSFNTQSDTTHSLNLMSSQMREIVSKKLSPSDLEAITRVAQNKNIQIVDPSSWKVIAPAYVIREIKEAMAISIKILLPFLLIDLLVAYVFTALGIHSMSSHMTAFSLKLLAFISADGLMLISTSLIGS